MASPTAELLAAAHEILAGQLRPRPLIEWRQLEWPREYYAGIDTTLRQATTAWFLNDQRSDPPRDSDFRINRDPFDYTWDVRHPDGRHSRHAPDHRRDQVLRAARHLYEAGLAEQRRAREDRVARHRAEAEAAEIQRRNDVSIYTTGRFFLHPTDMLTVFGTMPMPPETPEARAAREAADARAKELLRASLTAAEATEADKTGKVTLTGKSGARYRVPINGGFIEMVDAAGREMGQACAVPVGDMPTADRVLAKILHLKDDDTALMKIANVWPRVRLRQRTTPCNPLAPVGW